jgi:hypothetical protein
MRAAKSIHADVSMPRSAACLRIFAIIALLTACAPGMRGKEPPPDLVTGGRAGVAVMDFEDLSPLNPEIPDLQALLTGKAVETLQDSGKHAVVEREALLRILSELNIGSSELADPQNRLQLGRITGARTMVFGSYMVIGDWMRLDVRQVEVESGRIRKAVSHMAPAGDLQKSLKAVDTAVRELFHIPPPDLPVSE